jgi:hypothetical protein
VAVEHGFGAAVLSEEDNAGSCHCQFNRMFAKSKAMSRQASGKIGLNIHNFTTRICVVQYMQPLICKQFPVCDLILSRHTVDRAR